jgi:3-hydroxybutyryl-CoA dehydrogenase
MKPVIGILGAGTMGTGIAELAAAHGHPVRQFDIKGVGRLGDFADCDFVIEAIVEDLDAKKKALSDLQTDAILATNTSSLSVTAIASACKNPERVIGTHFFNPPTKMRLVEIVAGQTTSPATVQRARALVESWGKTTVLAKDTPGFIVNRVARPFYGEAIRIFEEGRADIATIDWAMREIGGFRLGPFQLMDLIGNDVNLKVTEAIALYEPSPTQKRLVEAGKLGRKTGQGFYDYRPNAVRPEPNKDRELGETIVRRIVGKIIEAANDVVRRGIATEHDVDLAMKLGANYPKGPFEYDRG